jgi:methylthioribose-1-phosphate isomerase
MTDDVLSPMRWEDGVLHLLDQLRLPGEEVWVACRTEEEVADAIRRMVVRGAPAIGCAAAYGVALAARRGAPLERAIDLLAAARPTAVNLFWALAEMRRAAGDPAALEARAIEIQKDDIAMCRAIGRHGAALIPDGATVLTHCNAGALATGGYGTALGVIRGAREAGKALRVLADETRPFLQGARLTAWELMKSGIDVTVIPDAAAAFLMSRGEVSCVVVGADRIAANGDVANKIGTYALAPAGVPGRYPAFDVTPAELVTAIITEQGIARPPYRMSGTQPRRSPPDDTSTQE